MGAWSMTPEISMHLLLIEEAILGLLIVAFTGWGGMLWKKMNDLSKKLDGIVESFHDDRIKLEGRLTALELKCERVERLMTERDNG